MTREARARWLALATAALVVALAALFAWLRNLSPAPVDARPAATTTVETGRAAFERMGCTACHSAEGRGNAGSPLDGVGARHDRDALRAWAYAGDATRGALPPAVAAVKRARAVDAQSEALIDYLERLR